MSLLWKDYTFNNEDLFNLILNAKKSLEVPSYVADSIVTKAGNYNDLLKYLDMIQYSLQTQIDAVTGGTVFSFNGRDGDVTLTSNDVTTALGYTPFHITGTINQYVRGDGSYATFPTYNSSFINDVGYITNITNKVIAGNNVTISGTGTDASPYRISASAGSGGGVIYPNSQIPYGDGVTEGGLTSPNFTYDPTNYFNVQVTNSPNDAGIWLNSSTGGMYAESNTEYSYLQLIPSGFQFQMYGEYNTHAGFDINNEGFNIFNFGSSWLWPSTDGSNGQVLTTNGSGTLSWEDGGIGSSSPITIENATSLLSTGITTYTGTTADNSLLLGIEAGQGVTAQKQVSLGYYAGNQAISAYNAVFIGVNAGDAAANANKSNFIGHRAGNNATYANHSTFIGRYVGTGATNANTSVFLGHYAGYNAANAAHSIFIGSYAGASDTVDNSASGTSILIGDNTSTGGFSNSIAIGINGTNTREGQIAFGDSYLNLKLAGLEYGLPTSHVTGYLTNNGSGGLSWSTIDFTGYATETYVNSQGFITSETDPVYTASSWFLTTNNASNWNTSFGWGNHASAGYLTTISGLNNNLLTNGAGYITSSALTGYLLSSTAASTYQPLDSDLSSWASITRATGFDTFVTTPNSANLKSLVTDETGSGALVFGTSPTFTTSTVHNYATASTVPYFDASKNLISSAVTPTQLSYVDATSSIQTQLDSKLSGYKTFNRQTSSYTLILADAGKIVEMNVGSTNNLTVPPNSGTGSVAFSIGTEITITQYSAFQTTIVAGTGVTLRSMGGWLKIAAQYGAVTLLKVDTNEWYIFGALTP